MHIKEYDGPERRTMTTEMYTTVCKQRFEGQNEEIREIRSDTSYLRSKIDNGLSEVPGKLDKLDDDLKKQNKKLLWGGITVILGLFLGSGVWLYNFGKITERLNNHINSTNVAIEEVQEDGNQ